MRAVSPVWRRLPAAAAGLAVAPLAAANGGYFPSSWGWATVAFLLAAASALLVRQRISLERREGVQLAALGGLAIWAVASALWAPTFEGALLEGERTLLYLAALLAVFVSLERDAVPSLLHGLCAGLAAVCAYALGTRLLPDVLGGYEPALGYQLGRPVGYWNALGLLAVLGALLALGLVAEGGRLERAGGAAALLVFLPTLFFTFSRGSSLALAAGAAAVFVAAPRRPRLLSAAGILAPFGAAALWLCAREAALTRDGFALAAATQAGHRLAVELAALAAVGAFAAAATGRAGARWTFGRTAKAAGVTAAVLACAAAAYGAPRAYRSFTAPLPAGDGDLTHRLGSLSANSRGDYWKVAWHQAKAHPLLGGGAASFERRWLRERPTPAHARDAHNLYLEALAEYGPPGLALLLVALAVPLTAVRRARSSPLAAGGAGAYVAFLVHAGLDWDWEVAAVTAAGLLCGASIVLAARAAPPRAPRTRTRTLALTALVPVLAAVGFLHVGNVAAAESASAVERGDAGGAEAAARRALHWAPWSLEARRRLGEAQQLAGDQAGARRSFGSALDRDPGDWALWYGLAEASGGRARAAALRRAAALNPLAPELVGTPFEPIRER